MRSGRSTWLPLIRVYDTGAAFVSGTPFGWIEKGPKGKPKPFWGVRIPKIDEPPMMRMGETHLAPPTKPWTDSIPLSMPT